MYNKPFKIHFPAFYFGDSRPPLTIKTIWFGIGDDNDNFFNLGDIYGNANKNVRITKMVETSDRRVRLFCGEIVLCDVLNVTKIDYV
jgi:hypothetical protein